MIKKEHDCNYQFKNLCDHLSKMFPLYTNNPTFEIKVKEANQAYLNATKSPFLVLGTASLREDPLLIQNLGTLATKPDYEPEKIRKIFQQLYPHSISKSIDRAVENHLKHGAVILDADWSVIKNDLFLLGNIHTGHEVHLGFLPTEEMLWNVQKNRPRILGREIFMLYQAGYTVHKSIAEYIFLPPEDPRHCLYLPQILAQLNQLKSPDPLIKFFCKKTR